MNDLNFWQVIEPKDKTEINKNVNSNPNGSTINKEDQENKEIYPERKRVQFWQTGVQKYRLELKSEMIINGMTVNNHVSNNYVFHLKEIDGDQVLIDVLSYDKEMIDCDNQGFKEMFAVSRQFEKLYDEFEAVVNLKGEVQQIKNLKALADKWEKLKKESVPYFGESTDLAEFFNLKDSEMHKPETWIQLLNEQEFFFLFFRLAYYGKSLNFGTQLKRDNAFKTNAINWNIHSNGKQEEQGTKDLIREIRGTFAPDKSWLTKSYGKMPFFENVPFKPDYQIQGLYRFDSQSGFIKQAEVFIQESPHTEIVSHKLKFTLKQITNENL